MTTPKFLATSIEEYNQHGTGILTNCGGDQLPTARSYPGTQPAAKTRYDLNKAFGEEWPDIELLFFDGDLVSAPPDRRNYVSSLAGLVAPFYRGNVTINSTDTSVNPIVSPNWLLDTRDQKIAEAGLERHTKSFRPKPSGPSRTGRKRSEDLM